MRHFRKLHIFIERYIKTFSYIIALFKYELLILQKWFCVDVKIRELEKKC